MTIAITCKKCGLNSEEVRFPQSSKRVFRVCIDCLRKPDTRPCTKCKEAKDRSEFRTRPNGSRQSWCKECMNKYSVEHALRYKSRRAVTVAELRKRNRLFIWEWLKNNPCFDCGETDPRLLEADHVQGVKKGDIAQLSAAGLSLEVLQEELDKCVTRCVRCHRLKTAYENNWWWTELIPCPLELRISVGL